MVVRVAQGEEVTVDSLPNSALRKLALHYAFLCAPFSTDSSELPWTEANREGYIAEGSEGTSALLLRQMVNASRRSPSEQRVSLLPPSPLPDSPCAEDTASCVRNLGCLLRSNGYRCSVLVRALGIEELVASCMPVGDLSDPQHRC